MSQDPNSTWCPTLPDGRPDQDRRQFNAGPSGRGGPADANCHNGWRPLLLTGLLRDLVVRHFHDPNQIEDPMLRKAIWRNDLTAGILVESVFRFDPASLGLRPAVLIKRNAYRSMRIVLNDQVGINEQGDSNYVTLWVGSHTLFCTHLTGASTELLATEVQRELNQFAPAVRNKLRLKRYQVMEVGEISEVEEAKKCYAVPVDVAWAYEETWKLSEEELPLAKIDFALDL